MATRATRAPLRAKRTVAEYLAAAPADKRAALTKLRRTIKAAAPEATEAISYGIIGYKHRGKALLYLGYAKGHCAIYGSTGTFVRDHAAELAGYDLSRGTIRFPPDRPLPDRLVRTMVRRRLAEIDEASA